MNSEEQTRFASLHSVDFIVDAAVFNDNEKKIYASFDRLKSQTHL